MEELTKAVREVRHSIRNLNQSRELKGRLENLYRVVENFTYKNKDVANTYNLNNLTIRYLGPDNPHRTWDIVDEVYGHLVLDTIGAIRQATSRPNDSQDMTMTDLQEALASADIILQELSDGIAGQWVKPSEKPEDIETKHKNTIKLRCSEQAERRKDTLLMLQKIVNHPPCSGDKHSYRVGVKPKPSPNTNKNTYCIKGFNIIYLGTDNPSTVWKIAKEKRGCIILDSLGCVRQAVKDVGSEDSQDMIMTDVQEALTTAHLVLENLSDVVKKNL